MTALSLRFAAELVDVTASAIALDGDEDRLDRGSRGVTSSLSVDQPRLDALESILSVASEASEPGWDGYDGKPILGSALGKAIAFFATLPSTLPPPDISAHPDGELAFYWSAGPRRALTVSVGSAGRVSFAALIGHQRLFGAEYLTDELPESIALALRQIHFDRG